MKKQKSLLKVSIAVLTFVFGCLAWAQTQSAPGFLSSTIQMLQEFAAQNAAQLRAYQWIETTTATVDGHTRPAQKSLCRFGPDGSLVRTPLDAQQNGSPQLKGGPVMRSMERKKMDEIKEEMAQVHEVTAMYLPLNPESLIEAVRTRQVGFEREPTGSTAVVLSNYAKQGDQLTFAMDSSARQIQSVSVRTFLSSLNDPLSITVQFSRLEDGTVYPSITNIQAPTEQISITTLSSDFSKPVL